MTTTWTHAPQDSQPFRAAGPVRVRYAPVDYVTLLWRELGLMVVVFIIIFSIGAALAFTLKKDYTAASSLFVRVGQEYVYQPRAGDAGRGAVPNIDQVVQSESEILNAGELKDRVIRRLGLGAVFPDLAKRYAAAEPADRPLILAKAREAMARNLGVETAPDNAIIRLTYKNNDPQVAVRVLNTLLEEYLVYRRGLLIAPDDSVMQRQRNVFETKLAQADQAYQDFLATNDIGDYPAQKASMVALQSQIDGLRFAAEAQLADRTARLASIQSQLAQTSPEIGLYRDASTVATDKLAALKLERESLLSRYKPDAQPVKDIDAQIAQLDAGVAAGLARQ